MTKVWIDQKTRIRRFLRDPDANIWDDALLLNLFNDEQHEMQSVLGHHQTVRVVRVPPQFQSAYMYDFEWAYNGNADGEVYRFGYTEPTDPYVCTHNWEVQQVAGVTPSTSSLGETYTQPWEAWVSGVTAAEPPPVYLPTRFHKMHFVAYDKEPLSHMTEREMYDRDQSWRSRGGKPYWYRRDDTLSNRLYLYPVIDSITWQDSTDGQEEPDSAEYASSGIDVDNNLLAVYDQEINPVTGDADVTEATCAQFMTKYLEYGVISSAYRANTDGRIESLADYWEFRKAYGIRAIKRYLRLRKVDRDYCLQTRGGEPIRSHRHPRLPDAYPAI